MSHNSIDIDAERERFIGGKDCEYRHTIQRLSSQSDRIDDFMIEVTPLMNYIKAEIKRNERRGLMYERITEHVLGAFVIAIFGFVGNWVISYVKIKYFNE